MKQKYFYRTKSGVRQFYFFQTNFLTCRAEDGPGRNQMNNGIFPAHLNAVATKHSKGLSKVTTINELRDLVAKTYNVFRDKFVDEAHEHPTYQAYRSVYAVFKHDPSRLNLSIPDPCG
jgi:hypothetical protein